MSDEENNQNTSFEPVKTEASVRPSKKEAVNTLWRRGILWWKLNKSQKDLYDIVNSTDKRIITFLCSRRFGKTYTLCVMAIEKCIKEKNSIVKYLCPDGKQAKTIVQPIIREILEDCPKGLRPEFLKNDGKYVFPNGSEIQLAGNDAGRAESLRGGFAHLCIIDEAGFCDNLKYNVRSIMLPTTLTTGGKIVLSSTPPATPGHEFVHFVEKSENDGTLVRKTIFDNPRMTQQLINETIEDYGSIEDNEFQREYLCRITIDLERAVVPEFTTQLKHEIVKTWDRPPFFDYYVAADIGFKDFTAVLFAYYDFKADKVIIEDELLINKMTTTTLAEKIKEKERILLTDAFTGEQKKPHLRISDNNLFVINDLYRLHSLTFLATAKDDKEAAINNMRILLASGKVVIHPRCITLIRHLERALWKKSVSGKSREFDRTEEDGHFDTIDALIYLLRNIQFSKNPYPKGYGGPSREHGFTYRDKKEDNDAYQQMANMFKIKKSI